MPIINIQPLVQGTDQSGQPCVFAPPVGLQLRGACLQVAVGLSKTFAQQLVQQGKPVPSPVTGYALLDIGAAVTCIDDNVASQLGLPAIDVALLSTASHAQSQANVYPAFIEVLGSSIEMDAGRAIGAPLAAQGLIALMGRDFLMRSVLIYNGMMGQFTLSVA